MLENPTIDSSASANIATVKRYAPPNQRNRSLGRRKSGGDRYINDGEKNQNMGGRNIPMGDHGDTSGSNFRSRLISMHGCSGNEAFRLHNDRWAAAINAHNNLPEDAPQRPVLYSGRSASPWGQVMLPHMLMQQNTGAQDFLGELQQAMHNANHRFDP